MVRISFKTFIFLLGVVFSHEALAKIQVVSTLPSFADLAHEIGGDDVEVASLSKGTQDPHYIDAKPDLVLKLKRADLLLHAGLELEIGWLPVLLMGSRNGKIQPGQPGNLDCSTVVSIKGIPAGQINRTMGDVHPGGNPHYMVDPRNAVFVTQAIAERLKKIDSSHSSSYDRRAAAYIQALKEKTAKWEAMLKPFKGTKIVPYHDSWRYFSDWAGFNEIGFIEPKPGIKPDPQYVSALVQRIKKEEIKLVVAQVFYPHDMAELVAARTGARFLVLPSEVNASADSKSYIEMMDAIVGSITGALKK